MIRLFLAFIAGLVVMGSVQTVKAGFGEDMVIISKLEKIHEDLLRIEQRIPKLWKR